MINKIARWLNSDIAVLISIPIAIIISVAIFVAFEVLSAYIWSLFFK